MKLFGETITVNAEITRLEGISGHADQAGLLRWLGEFKQKPQHVFVVHGENETCDSFAALLQNEYGYQVDAPYFGASWDLAVNRCLYSGTDLEQKKAATKPSRPNNVFLRLVAAGQRLMAVIKHNEGGTNKDLAKFADQISNLCDKWER